MSPCPLARIRNLRRYNADSTTAWQQRGSSTTRVNFSYTADRLPDDLTMPVTGQVNFAYSSVGNLRKEVTSLGFVT